MPDDAPHRKTMRRRERPGQARFLTFSCYRRIPLFANDRIKEVFATAVERARARHRFTVWAWVIMPDHVHLLVSPAVNGSTIDRALNGLKNGFARSVLTRFRHLNAPILNRLVGEDGTARFWQAGGGYDRNVYSQHEFEEKRWYIHQNPVKRKLVAQPCDWAWSSARAYAGLPSPITIGSHTVNPAGERRDENWVPRG